MDVSGAWKCPIRLGSFGVLTYSLYGKMAIATDRRITKTGIILACFQFFASIFVGENRKKQENLDLFWFLPPIFKME